MTFDLLDHVDILKLSIGTSANKIIFDIYLSSFEFGKFGLIKRPIWHWHNRHYLKKIFLQITSLYNLINVGYNYMKKTAVLLPIILS